MTVRSATLLLLTLAATQAGAQTATLERTDESALASASAIPIDPQSAWNQLLRGIEMGASTGPTEVAKPLTELSPAEALTQREAEIAAINEHNRLRQAELDALSKIVQQRDADLARRTAEQAELAERIAQLEAAMQIGEQSD